MYDLNDINSLENRKRFADWFLGVPQPDLTIGTIADEPQPEPQNDIQNENVLPSD